MTTFVSLNTDDAAELHALQNAAYKSEADSEQKHLPDLHQSLETVRSELSDPDVLCFGLRDEQGALVAAIRSFVAAETATVGRLCVHPEKQGRGLATHLLGEIERHVPDRIREVQIFTAEDALASRHFYSKLGYVDVKHDEMEAGYTIVQLTKKLSSARRSRGRLARLLRFR